MTRGDAAPRAMSDGEPIQFLQVIHNEGFRQPSSRPAPDSRDVLLLQKATPKMSSSQNIALFVPYRTIVDLDSAFLHWKEFAEQ
jgi:hypothetical protein